MRYYDYYWDLDEGGISLDEEINIDKLGWKAGDVFQLKNINGRVRLVKLDEFNKFMKGIGNE